jgi:uncharacterized protein YerC
MTNEQKQLVGQMLDDKKPYSQIAKDLGITTDQVEKAAIRLGKQRRVMVKRCARENQAALRFSCG